MLITDDGRTYLIRGPWTPAQLTAQYWSFVAKYPDTRLLFGRWLVERGKVYVCVSKKTRSEVSIIAMLDNPSIGD